MASGFSDDFKNKLLRWLNGSLADPRPATLYFTLHAAAFNPAGMASEFASGNWARVAVARNSGNFGVAANVFSLLADQAGVELNAQQQAGANALSWAAYDAANGGNMVMGGDLAGTDQKPYTTNDQWVVKGTTTTLTLS